MGTHHGGMGKRLLAGRAASVGVFSAQLAQHGFTNVDNIFESGYGSFPSAFNGGANDFDLEELTKGLGSDFRSLGVAFKVWACRAPIHPALEAISSLRTEVPFSPQDVLSLTAFVPEVSFKAVGFPYKPSSTATAQLNMHYCVAVMLLENQVGIAQFSDSRLAAPEVLEMAQRVHVLHDPSLDEPHRGLPTLRARVELELADGRHLSRIGTLRDARAVAATEVETKFIANAANVVDHDRASGIVQICSALMDVGDTTKLTTLLSL